MILPYKRHGKNACWSYLCPLPNEYKGRRLSPLSCYKAYLCVCIEIPELEIERKSLFAPIPPHPTTGKRGRYLLVNALKGE